jgi:hypothetical protein
VRLAHGAKETCHHAIKQEKPRATEICNLNLFFGGLSFDVCLSDHGNPVWPLILA